MHNFLTVRFSPRNMQIFVDNLIHSYLITIKQKLRFE